MKRASVALFFMVCAASCSSPSTPAGPLGTFSLVAQNGPLAPPTAAARERVFTREICGSEGFAPAVVSVKQRAVVAEGQGWLIDATVDLVTPSAGLVVRPAAAPPATGGKSLTPGDPWNGVATLVLDCDRNAWRGIRQFSLHEKAMIELVAIEP